ncbi:hypothetical protein DFH06DRAFT_1282412 [Mycena polygramma]|nr:hypothetical protein DFH06DRAFT_1282412 [Mycena polygramma]
MPDLPFELWTQVFDLAADVVLGKFADEDVIFQHGLPMTMAESAWFKDFFGEWALRSPQDALGLVQTRSYATKKAIVRTCKRWRDIGSEFLFRCLYFNNPARLLTLCAHPYCPNLEIFIIDWPLTVSTFGPIADALATFTSKSLRTLHVNVPTSALPKVIWALDSLPRIFAAHIELELCTAAEELANSDHTHLGAAGDISLRLPHLQQLSLQGQIQEFVEQATGWTLPALRHVSLNCGTRRVDLPDTLAFLAMHGAPLLFLDLYSTPAMPLQRILAACPALTTLAFNADWRLVRADDDDDDDEPPLAHERLSSVGLHGLAYAFGVGFAAAHAHGDPLPALLVTSANDCALAALCVRESFPALRRVRVLSRSLLGELDRANGPAEEGGGMARWERWWEACNRAGVRLEDCTGALLGELPQDPPESESEEEDEDEEDNGDYEQETGEWRIAVPPMDSEGGTHINELRRLLDECRAMEAGRDDDYMFANPDAKHLHRDEVSLQGLNALREIGLDFDFDSLDRSDAWDAIEDGSVTRSGAEFDV